MQSLRQLTDLDRGSGGDVGSARDRGLKWQLCPSRQTGPGRRRAEEQPPRSGWGRTGWPRLWPLPSPPSTHGHRRRGSHRSPGSTAGAAGVPSSPPGGTRSGRQLWGRPRGGPQSPLQRPRLPPHSLATGWPWEGLGHLPTLYTGGAEKEHSLFAPHTAAHPHHTPHLHTQTYTPHTPRLEPRCSL